MDLPVDAYVPGDYVPYEAAKIEIHRRVAGAREVAELIVLREELEDRFGPVPEPLDNLIRLQDARIKLGRAGARSVDFRGGRHAVVADRARLARAPRRCASAAGGGLRVRPQHGARAACPRSRRSASRAVVAAAEAILEVGDRAQPASRLTLATMAAARA